MRGLCIRDFRLLWANSSSSVASAHLIHGPIWLYFLAVVLLQAHMRVLCGSPFCAGWANVSSLPEYYGVGSGPMQGLCIRDYRLLWAISSPSVTSAHLIHGPIQLYFLAALLLQAHASLVQQPILCWMGQCKLIAQILWCKKWAHVRTLHKGFQTAVGQLKLISSIHAFNPWANLIIFPGSSPAAGPHESLVQQPILCWMGQCKLIAQILWCRKWAHSRTLHKGFQTAVGQLELISDICAFNPWANLIILPHSTSTAGPCESLVQQPILCWMGQCKLIAQILWCRKWAHARTFHKGFQTAVGQLKLVSNIHAFNPWANLIIFPCSTPTAGPHKSLVWQPILCWMGQCKLIA